MKVIQKISLCILFFLLVITLLFCSGLLSLYFVFQMVAPNYLVSSLKFKIHLYVGSSTRTVLPNLRT